MKWGYAVGCSVIGCGLAWGIRAMTLPPIAFWGDSLTVHRLPFAFALLTQRRVLDGGVSGQTSTQILARLQRAPSHWSDVTVLWMGRNNIHQPERIESDIAAAVSLLGHDRYLVLSVINGDWPAEWRDSADYKTIQGINLALARRYGSHFVDVRRFWVAMGSGSDSVHDIPPRTLRVDRVHPNTLAKARLAMLLKNRIQTAGW